MSLLTPVTHGVASSSRPEPLLLGISLESRIPWLSSRQKCGEEGRTSRELPPWSVTGKVKMIEVEAEPPVCVPA